MSTRHALLRILIVLCACSILIVLCACSLSAAAINVTVSTPTNGATTTSPVKFVASATSSHNITGWRIYVDSVSVYKSGATTSISTSLAMPLGTHSVVVEASGSSGARSSVSLSLTVQSVAISISPTSATLQTGLSQQFHASVTGTTNTGVSWWVNGVQGGNSTVGTISSTGLYIAPASVPSGGSVTVTAQSTSDSTKTANATVAIKAAATPVTVSLSPLAPTVNTGATQQFAATVSGTTSTAVVWQVNGVQGGNTTVGTITSAGLYTAPAVVPTGTVTVTAVSSFDSTASASTTVSVIASSTPVAVSISPTSATLSVSQTKQFTASVTGTTNTSAIWLVNGIQGGNSTTGTISSSGVYTAPASVPSGSITVTAKSAYDTTKSASAGVTITAASVNQYYVSTTGSDSNDGLTPSTAWATINHANSALSLGAGGTVVHVASGIYYGANHTTSNGTASARIRYMSDVQYGAILKGSSGGSIWVADGSYTDIVGFDFDGSSYPGIAVAISTDNGSSAVNTTHVRILNNKMHDTAGSCNTTGNAVVLLNADVGTESITTSNNTVDGNLIYHNNCGASGSTPNNGGQHGIYSQNAGDVIRDNMVADQGGGWCIVSWHKVTNWTVVNNTVANCPNGGITLADDSSTGVFHNYDTIVNNIVVNSGNSSTGNGGIDFRMCGTGNVVQNNLMFGNVPSNYVGSCSGATLAGTQSGANSTTFVNYTGTGSGDYHSPSGSAAINNGTTTCASGMSPCVPVIDFEGGTRPGSDGLWDIGAYEYGSSAGIWPWQ